MERQGKTENSVHPASTYVDGNPTLQETIPIEIVFYMLSSFCDQKTQCAARQVCGQWRSVFVEKYPATHFLNSATDLQLEEWFKAAYDDRATVEKIAELITHDAVRNIKRLKIFSANYLKKRPQEETPLKQLALPEQNCLFYGIAVIDSCALRFISEGEDATLAEKELAELFAKRIQLFREVQLPCCGEEAKQVSLSGYMLALVSNDFKEIGNSQLFFNSHTDDEKVILFNRFRNHASWDDWAQFPGIADRQNALSVMIKLYAKRSDNQAVLKCWEDLKELTAKSHELNQYPDQYDQSLGGYIIFVFNVNRDVFHREKNILLKLYPDSPMIKLSIANKLIEIKPESADNLKEALGLIKEALLLSTCDKRWAKTVMQGFAYSKAKFNEQDQRYIFGELKTLLSSFTETCFSSDVKYLEPIFKKRENMDY